MTNNTAATSSSNPFIDVFGDAGPGYVVILSINGKNGWTHYGHNGGQLIPVDAKINYETGKADGNKLAEILPTYTENFAASEVAGEIISEMPPHISSMTHKVAIINVSDGTIKIISEN